MCVNDLVVQGAEPLFFLITMQREIIIGFRKRSDKWYRGRMSNGWLRLDRRRNGEMPGMYNGNDYDLAGFAVGAVERQDC